MKRTLLTLLIILTVMAVVGCTGTNQSTTDFSGSGAEPQVVSIGLVRGVYTPITVEANRPVTLRNDGTLRGCALYPVQPELGMNANFARETEYTFTPTKTGEFTYSCSMGMFHGRITVV